MAPPERFLYEVFRLNDDGTRTLVRECITESTTFRVGVLSPGWHVTYVYALSPEGARSEPSRLPFFMHEDGGSMVVSRHTGIQSGAGSHIQ